MFSMELLQNLPPLLLLAALMAGLSQLKQALKQSF